MGTAHPPGGLPSLQRQARNASCAGIAYCGSGGFQHLQNFLNLWLAEEQTYRKEWTPTLLSGVLATLPDSPLPGQEDARTPALWHALAVGPAFLTCLCDTFWGADGHLAALLGACSYGLAANRTSVFITGAPRSTSCVPDEPAHPVHRSW